MCDEAPLHSGDHSLRELELRRRFIAGDHDLFALIEQRFKGVAKFLFKVESILQELNIIDEEQIEIAIVALHLIDRFIAQVIDNFIDECFGCDRMDAQFLMVFADIMADAVEQVGFSQPYAAMNE